MNGIKKYLLWENLVYVVLWAILFIAPVLSFYARSTQHHDVPFMWMDILRIWRLYLVYLAAFLIHNFLIAPFLVYRRKRLAYFAGVFCVMALFMTYQCLGFVREPHKKKPGMEMMDHRVTQPEGKGPHHGRAFDEDSHPSQFDPIQKNMPPQEGMPKNRHIHEGPPLGIGLMHIFQLVVMILALGMNLGIKLYFKNQEDQKELKELESRSLEQQLSYLKYQINPHFYMNTLNNIHALVDIDPEKAKETILILSKIMRYVLYECDKHLIAIGREVEFVKNYIHLMKIRYTDRVKITTSFPEQMPEAGIPPLVLVSFVENAFKHGVSYKQDSFIDVGVEVNGGHMKFTCKNSKINQYEYLLKKEGGVGLANVKQRLDIIYGDHYTLDIQENLNTYEVLLLLPLSQNL